MILYYRPVSGCFGGGMINPNNLIDNFSTPTPNLILESSENNYLTSFVNGSDIIGNERDIGISFGTLRQSDSFYLLLISILYYHHIHHQIHQLLYFIN